MAASPITHVFVLMLENHSFDNILGLSGLAGIEPPSGRTNRYDGCPYPVSSPAPASMSTDPGHEFADVLQQLCGPGAAYSPAGHYPKVDNSGFASSYATSTSEPPHKKPLPERVGDIMACFDTRSQLPVMYQLASEFVVCDAWFASVPGPTWPNRFFVHGASSMGFYDSPTLLGDELKWWTTGGFHYNHGSIYDALKKAQVPWRLYIDRKDQFSDDPASALFGFIPQVASLEGVQLWDVEPFSGFAGDVARVDEQGHSQYPYQYTFIEPNWGESVRDTYVAGSAQHPMDGMRGGERLIKATYEAIRNSPLWNSSLLIITYDEHGGFYDHVCPPAAPAPRDDPPLPPAKGQDLAFTFKQFGVRVPAVIVSPWVGKGRVDSTVYDHTSILATLERLFNFGHLTERDGQANDLRHLVSPDFYRTDCPVTLTDAAPAPVRPAALDDAAELGQLPLHTSGNMAGFLGVLRKAELELSKNTPLGAAELFVEFAQLKTRADAQAYASAVLKKADEVRAQRKATGA